MLAICRIGFIVCFVAVCVGTPRYVAAERPTAPYLLPSDTLAYVRIANVPDMIEKFRDTSMGRISADEKVQPFVGDLYRSAIEAFSRVEDRVGLPLDELLAIPQGEFCLAIVPPDEGQPQFVALIDVADHWPAAERVIENAELALADQGATRTTQLVGEVEVVTHEFPGDRQRRLVFCEREGLLLIASDDELAKQILRVWDTQDVASLADNRTFTAIMKRSMGFKDERPQITWYVDPVALAKRATRGNFSAQTGIALLSSLGLDGLKAIGGSLILATEEFDGIFHTHFMLDNPRNGALKMIALEAGEVTPEMWVPKDVASYSTLNWNVEKTYAELVRLFDMLRGENAWKQQVTDMLSQRLDIDLETEVIQALEGRATRVTWMERPARLNSQSNLFGFQLLDATRTQRTLDRVVAKLPERFERKSYGGVSYYRVRTDGQAGNNNADAELTRAATPCLAVLGDHFIVTDSEKLLEQAIITKSDSSLSLANELDFKLIANKIARQQGETKAGMISFSRPEEGFRLIYELATAQTARSRLASGADNNEFFKALNGALSSNPIPPFAVLAKYLAPGGALVTDDETGIHYTAFTLRRD